MTQFKSFIGEQYIVNYDEVYTDVLSSTTGQISVTADMNFNNHNVDGIGILTATDGNFTTLNTLGTVTIGGDEIVKGNLLVDNSNPAPVINSALDFEIISPSCQQMFIGNTACQNWTRRSLDNTDVNEITAVNGKVWTAGNTTWSDLGNYKFRTGLSSGSIPPTFSIISDLYWITGTETQNYVNSNMMNNDIINVNNLDVQGEIANSAGDLTFNDTCNFSYQVLDNIQEIQVDTLTPVAPATTITVSGDIDASTHNMYCNNMYLKGAFYNAGVPTDIEFGDNIDMMGNDINFLNQISNGASSVILASTLDGTGQTIQSQVLQTTNVLATGTITTNTLTTSGKGAVTQVTSIVTPVTINNSSGTITTVPSGLGANGATSFLVNNSTVSSSSTVLANIVNYSGGYAGGGVAGLPVINIDSVASGSFNVALMNASNTFALAGSITIGFMVI